MKLQFIALALCVVSQTASATTFFGTTLRLTGENPTMGNVVEGPSDKVVDASVEWPSFYFAILQIDVSDTNILITFPGSTGTFGAVAFNGIHFSDVNGAIGNFLSVTIAANNVSGFNASRITFDANNIFVNFQGLNPSPSTGMVSLAVLAAPEPAAIFSLAAGLGVLALISRWRRSNI